MTRPEQLDVRPALEADLASASELFDQYRRFQGQPSDVSAARAFLAARLERQESVVFLAWWGAAPVGFAQLYPMFSSVSLSRVFVLNDLFVSAATRSRGVARALLASVEAHAWEHGASRVTLNVAKSNSAAQALYQRSGWLQDEQFFMFHRHPPPRASSGDAA